MNRNIKLRAIDLLNGQSINKQFKDLKPGTTLNQNDLSLKDLWKIPLQNKLNADLEKLKNQFDNASEDIKLDLKTKLLKFNREMIYYLLL